MAGRVLTGDRSVVKTFGIDACWENTFRPNWSFMRLFAPSCRLEKTDTLPNLMEVYAPFSRGRVFSRLTATSQGVIERPFCRLSSQPVIFQLTLVTPFKKAHSLGTLCRVAPARKKTFQGTELSRMWYYLQHLSCLEREFQGYQIGYDCENHAWDKWKILLSRHIFWNVTLRGLLEMDQKMNYLIHVFMFVVHFFCCFLLYAFLIVVLSQKWMNSIIVWTISFLPQIVGRVVVKASVSPSGIPACMHSLNQCK